MNIRKMMGLRLPHSKSEPKLPISATEARSKALEAAELNEKNEIEYIFLQIQEKANNGEFELCLRETLPDSIKEHFINYGYKVETINILDIEKTKISW